MAPHGDRRARLVVGAAVVLGMGVAVLFVYLLPVLGVWALTGSEGPNVGVMLVATAVVAVAFEPARRMMQRLARRLVPGVDVSPSEAVEWLAATLGRLRRPEEALQELVSLVGAATGDRDVAVWLDVDGERRLVATTCDDPPELPVASIRHGGETLGVLAVSDPATLSTTTRRLVEDAASAAGIVTRTVHLHEELRARLAVARTQHKRLVSARARTVQAQDVERRRLERLVHDTCQGRAVVVATRLGEGTEAALTGDLVLLDRVLEDAEADLAELTASLAGAVRSGSSSGGGQAIGDFLVDRTQRLPVRVEVADRLSDRYGPAVEEAVSLVCLEAVQNAVRHAGAARVVVELREQDGVIAFVVRDDGSGFDVEAASSGTGLRGMHERVSVVGGSLGVESGPRGTRVEGQVPLAPGGSR